MDEKKPYAQNAIKIKTTEVDGTKLIFLKNVKNKRKLVNILGTYQDNVQYFAIEGSTLTIAGLVNYDAKSDCFRMTDLTSIIAGGVEETCVLLRDRVKLLSADAKTCFYIGATCFLIGGLALYFWNKDRR